MNFGKKITILILSLLSITSTYSQELKSYRLDGHLAGAKDGLMVYLSDATDYPYIPFDSTRIQSEKFTFHGRQSLKYPIRVQLVVDRSPAEKDERKKNRNAAYFFLDNSTMTLACPIDSMPSIYYEEVSREHNVIIQGGITQELYGQNEASIKELNAQRKTLDRAYISVYHLPSIKGVFHTKEGMGIVSEEAKIKQQIRDITLDFIKNNPSSVVSIELARQLLDRSNASMKVEEIKSLLALIDPSLKQSPSFLKLKEVAERELVIAHGVPFMDIKLKNTEGKEVQLADYIKPGQYNMLEFWASWCSPCRGEIPHLKHINKILGDSFNMISISIDSKDSDWKRALAVEQMPWLQLVDNGGFKGPVSSIYKVMGVPHCIIVDKQGKMIYAGLRGAQLDLILSQLYGEDFKIN